MAAERTYPGIDKDRESGMTDIARIIRDAWIFGLLDEGETCAGWSLRRIQALYDKVFQAWEPYGHLVSSLPAELRQRHDRISAEALQRAQAAGWTPPMETDD